MSSQSLGSILSAFERAGKSARSSATRHNRILSPPRQSRRIRASKYRKFVFFYLLGCRELASGEQASRAARIFRNAPQLPPLAPDQMEAAIRMLTRAVEENHWKQHQSQFPEQLLNVTLQFLRNLMQDQTAAGGDASTADGEESKIPLDKLAEYLGKLRKFVQDRSVSPTERSVVKERTDMTQNWDNGDVDVSAVDEIISSVVSIDSAIQIVVRDGFLKNSLPVIQAWLLGQRRVSSARYWVGV